VVLNLGRIWAQRGHAELSSRQYGKGALAKGEAIDALSMRMLNGALIGEYVVVNRVPTITGTRRVPGAGRRIWEAVLQIPVLPGLERLDLGIVEGPTWDRVHGLALNPSLRELLARRGRGKRLDHLLRDAGLQLGRIAAELRGLLALDMIRLRPVLGAEAAKAREQAAREDAASLTVSRSASRRRRNGSGRGARQGRRKRHDVADLQRQLRIFGKVDPWRSFGLRKTASDAQVQAAADRLRERYTARSGDSDEVVALLGELRAAITRAARQLGEQGRARKRWLEGASESDPRLDKGRSLLARGGATAALAILTEALEDNPRSAAHHTWFARAVFLSPARSPRARAALAVEHLERAAGLPGPPREHAAFLAEARALLAGQTSAGDEDQDELLFGEALEAS